MIVCIPVTTAPPIVPVRRDFSCGGQRLTTRAVPRSAAGRPDLLDRRPAAWTRLAGAAVDAELLLHAPAPTVRSRVVAQAGTLARDSCFERVSDATREARHLVLVERARRTQR